ncbi:hypothetical protein IFM89_008770 [Coptis chinensis]|uniref:DUF7032 domain-containing protein n=1 Tax=Coptis chinensis TaxID=261450 RepID=A0A835LBJ2_9MAGN|nr:hypothetical protein IFM89_008770 [Coptis chinensis]
MEMRKYGGSPRDVKNNFSFMLRANVFYNEATSSSPMSVTIFRTPQKLRYDQIPAKNRGSPVKRNWNGTGILTTPPRRRPHVEQPTDNMPVAAEERVLGLEESRTTLFEKSLSVAVVVTGLGGPNLIGPGHGSDTQAQAQEVRDGHMGLLNMTGTSYGDLVVWSPDMNGSGMDLDEDMGALSSLILLTHSIKVFHVKWQLIRSKLEELNSVLTTAMNCDFGAIVVSKPCAGASCDDVKFYVNDLMTWMKIGCSGMKNQTLMALNEILIEDEKYVTTVVEIGGILSLLVKFLEVEDMEIQDESMKVISVITSVDCYKSTLVEAGIIGPLYMFWILEVTWGKNKQQGVYKSLRRT